MFYVSAAGIVHSKYLPEMLKEDMSGESLAAVRRIEVRSLARSIAFLC